MHPLDLPIDYPRIQCVNTFAALVNTPFAAGVNALCWPRPLPPGFDELARLLGPGEGVVTLDAARLRSLPLSLVAQVAVDRLLADLQLLRDQDLDPVLNCIHDYPRDEDAAVVATDVFSFHADSAPVPAATWLCTYHGLPSEGLRNEEARRRVDVPDTRAALLAAHGGADDDHFRAHLQENCYDLHYTPVPGARPFSFGLGHLWRIAVDYPDSPVPPCIHRAPTTVPGGPPRLLLIS